MKVRCLMVMAGMALSVLLQGAAAGGEGFGYPESPREGHVDVYHGTQVADPYRWLEEDVRQSTRVRKWVTAQNKVSFGYLKSLPAREGIEKRLTALWNYEKFRTPFKAGGRYYLAKNSGLQNHFVVYVMDSLDGERRVLLNPNDWSEDGTVALGAMSFSDDGQFVAYAVQDAGSDWRTWKVRNIETGEDLSDTLGYLKFTGVAWDPQSAGFFYAKYPDPEASGEFQALNKEMKVMYHRLGDGQDADAIVYWRPDHPEWGYGVEVTDDGRYLVITIWVGTDDKFRIMYRELDHPYAMPVDLIGAFENDYTFIDNDGPVFYFRTDYQAPNGQVIAIDTRQPDRRDWRVIIPEAQTPLEEANLLNNLFVCTYLKDVTTQVKLFTLAGRHLRDVAFPGLGTATGFSGKRADTETFYSFQSYILPPSTYRYDLVSGVSALLERPSVDCDFADYAAEQVLYTSRDGTRVPMFINYKKPLAHDGARPTLLYGYGGFNISLRPRFSVSRLAWMEMGGVYAVANLRGGGEYGQAWHEGGKKLNKQNVFDDFIAAAEYLIETGTTRADKLAILGGSNGGLLVGACMTQRPELFAAAVPAVGVMDMLRFDAFTAGRFWVDDYGSARKNRAMFDYLKGYSPYHNLRGDVRYPSTLIMTADTDDRVVPGHSFKFAAQLQHSHIGENPVLIRIETRAGHGDGKPTTMLIEEQADMYAFIGDALGMRMDGGDE